MYSVLTCWDGAIDRLPINHDSYFIVTMEKSLTNGRKIHQYFSYQLSLFNASPISLKLICLGFVCVCSIH